MTYRLEMELTGSDELLENGQLDRLNPRSMRKHYTHSTSVFMGVAPGRALHMAAVHELDKSRETPGNDRVPNTSTTIHQNVI